MKKLWNGWQLDAGGLALLGVFTLLGTWLGLGAALDRRAQREALDREQAELIASRTEAHTVAESLTERIADAHAELAQREFELRPESDLNAVFADLGQMAQRFGLAVDQLEPGSPESGPLFRTVPLKVIGRGDFPSIASFLRSATVESPDLAIRTFSVTAAPTSGESSARFEIDFAWRAVSNDTP